MFFKLCFAQIDTGGAAAGPSAYGIVKPIAGKKDNPGAGGPFDMKNLLDTLSVKQKETKSKQKVSPAGAVGGGTLAGISTIIKKDNDGRKSKIVGKFKKDVTIKPTPTKSDTVVSVSDIDIAESSEFEETLRGVQSRVASDAFNVMQLIVKTMTGLFPVCVILSRYCLCKEA